MRNLLKKTSIASLGLITALSLTSPSFAASNTQVKTEQGYSIGVGTLKLKGSPEIKSRSLKSSETLINESENEIRRMITINPSDAQTVVEVPFELNNGEYLVLTKDDQGDTNGTANIYSQNGKSVGIVSTSLGNDKELELIDAEVNDDTLELKVAAQELTQSTDLIVTAAATYYSTYFSDFAWITRDGVKSLSLTHTKYTVSAPNGAEFIARLNDSWDKVYSIHSTSSNWSNTGGMKDQYQCHFYHATSKNPWNLEPSRPNVSYSATVAALCNPK